MNTTDQHNMHDHSNHASKPMENHSAHGGMDHSMHNMPAKAEMSHEEKQKCLTKTTPLMQVTAQTTADMSRCSASAFGGVCC
ncbi:hypothetical protein [Candidatus Villigracilis affinis]|uniref:hypothetical protein n=1 Tax=Candidatus Villigracilis affinis TaxID=3140682 RepID=UPI001DB89E7F|nr:hypothetical protein [Anaerolineales bacterium]